MWALIGTVSLCDDEASVPVDCGVTVWPAKLATLKVFWR
jgi:hypothetical protein